MFLPTIFLVPLGLRLISVQAAHDLHGDESSSAYVKVHREWDKRNEAGQTQTSKPGSNQTKEHSGFMLQRWQQEPMLDQPFNNLEAVKKRTDLEYGKQIANKMTRILVLIMSSLTTQ